MHSHVNPQPIKSLQEHALYFRQLNSKFLIIRYWPPILQANLPHFQAILTGVRLDSLHFVALHAPYLHLLEYWSMVPFRVNSLYLPPKVLSP